MSTNIDNERLAALLDGRLSPSERTALLARLAESDRDTLGALADAVALLDDTDPRSTGKHGRTETTGLGGAFRVRFAMGAVAAGLIGILAFELIGRPSRESDRPPPGRPEVRPFSTAVVDYTTDFVAQLAVFGASPAVPQPNPGVRDSIRGAFVAAPNASLVGIGNPDRASHDRPLANSSPQPVGQGFPDRKVDEIVGAVGLIPVQVGSLLTDLRFASRGRGSREASAGKLAVLLGGLGQARASALFDSIARAPAGSRQASDSAITLAVRSVRPIDGSTDWLTVGALMEAARFATTTKDTAFFTRNWPLLTSRISALPDGDARRSLAVEAFRLRYFAFKPLDGLMSETRPRASTHPPLPD